MNTQCKAGTSRTDIRIDNTAAIARTTFIISRSQIGNRAPLEKVIVTFVDKTLPEVCPVFIPILLMTVPTPGSLIVVDKVLLVPDSVLVGE